MDARIQISLFPDLRCVCATGARCGSTVRSAASKNAAYFLKPTRNHRVNTMDVWFDSGTSWASVLDKQRWPADTYLEGSDQHGGWFNQSSLLTSVATMGSASYRQVLTHGFVLDGKNVKMSKSAGNVVDPHTVILGGKNQKEQPAYGADVLRLWVCSVDYTGDVSIGPHILKQTAEVYRKLRGTLRYLLSNLHDWNAPELSIDYGKLPAMDRYALLQLSGLVDSLQESLDKYQFAKFFQSVQRYAVLDLSRKLWSVLLKLRVEVNKVLESARTGKLIGAGLDAQVYIYLEDETLRPQLQDMGGSDDGVDKLHVEAVASEAEGPYTGSSSKVRGSSAWIGVKRAGGNKWEAATLAAAAGGGGSRETGTAHCVFTHSNIFVTITDFMGNTKTQACAGMCGFKGTRRGSKSAAIAVAERASRAAAQLGMKAVEVRLNGGFGAEKRTHLLQGLKQGGLLVLTIRDVTAIPFNGCRPPKRRRI